MNLSNWTFPPTCWSLKASALSHQIHPLGGRRQRAQTGQDVSENVCCDWCGCDLGMFNDLVCCDLSALTLVWLWLWYGCSIGVCCNPTYCDLDVCCDLGIYCDLSVQCNLVVAVTLVCVLWLQCPLWPHCVPRLVSTSKNTSQNVGGADSTVAHPRRDHPWFPKRWGPPWSKST